MAALLSRQSIDGLIVRTRTVKSRQLELDGEREAGRSIEAGERLATWLLRFSLRNGKVGPDQGGRRPAILSSFAWILTNPNPK
jgi:hypothetical protein